MPDLRRDLLHTVLSLLVIGGLILGAVWTLRPFLPAILWATMIVVATWPVMRFVQRLLWGKRWLAVAAMTLAMLLIFIVPFVLAIGAIIVNADEMVAWGQSLTRFTLPPPPDWVQSLPLVGEKIVLRWRELVQSGVGELATTLEPYARDVLRWLAAEAGSVGKLAVQILLSVLVAAILYAHGEALRAFTRAFGRRLAGARGEAAIQLAGQAIRAVAMGVVITALAQALVGGIGLAIAGVPFASVLTAAMFLLAVIQIGAAPLLFCASAWLYWSDQTGWAIAMLVWTAIVASLDNVLRPFLIRQGADLPLLLIFAGVIGGLLAFGLVGIFIGPAVLAVGYKLLEDWMHDDAAAH